MTPETVVRLRAAFDFVWESCMRDSQGNLRSDIERLTLYSRYIGWLEGIALSNLTDNQAHGIIESISIIGADDAADEADVHDNENGSFY